MAINISDFNKIWASTSPLTPYAFSDNNYKQGWNFVGATPPARQMWDSYMKFSDEKQQYIVNNFLPLSGGTMTGDINYGEKTSQFSKYNNNSSVSIVGGNTDSGIGILSKRSGFKDTYLILSSGDQSTNPRFRLLAGDGTTSKELVGKPDGTLTWGGKSIPDRSYGFSLAGGGSYTFTINENGAVIFAKRGNNCSCHMVDYYGSNSVKIFSTSTDSISITKSANSNSVTITNETTIGIALKILNGGTL